MYEGTNERTKDYMQTVMQKIVVIFLQYVLRTKEGYCQQRSIRIERGLVDVAQWLA